LKAAQVAAFFVHSDQIPNKNPAKWPGFEVALKKRSTAFILKQFDVFAAGC